MRTISSTEKLVPLIEDLSRSISEIASVLKSETSEETKTEEPVKKTRAKKTQAVKEEEITEQTSSGADSSEEINYTKEQVKAFLLTKNLDDVKALYKELDVKKLSDIPVEKYPEVMKKAAGFKDKEDKT